MIIAAIAAALAASLASRAGQHHFYERWIEQWRKLIRKHIEDPERRDALHQTLAEESARIEDYFEAMLVEFEAFRTTHGDYASTLADYERTVDALSNSFETIQDAQLQTLTRERERMSAAEWTAIRAEIGAQLDKDEQRAKG